ncbi:hypothetical protein AAIH70_24900 [Neorhizobium sp. BT27B]|uniref:hypothetical protein n=1 Tax=Rhizobiaceae TaxID=82115 RepID=UPI001F27CCAE|nr:hypothetical protein [Endobacterium cereale]MEB2848366.1 hypothetical protein [Endobacterium cereale]
MISVHRPAGKVSLHVRATLSADTSQLLGSFDALGRDGHAKTGAETFFRLYADDQQFLTIDRKGESG